MIFKHTKKVFSKLRGGHVTRRLLLRVLGLFCTALLLAFDRKVKINCTNDDSILIATVLKEVKLNGNQNGGNEKNPKVPFKDAFFSLLKVNIHS